jgi:hydrogenase maturation protein HypF
MMKRSLLAASSAQPLLRVARHSIRVRGVVQGVGFRPFVHRLATELALSGWVRNDAEGVAIEVQGAREALDRFLVRLRREAPQLARIDGLEAREQPIQRGAGFRIEDSRGGAARTGVAPDMALCTDCLKELFDPRDRRWRHPFITCTQCGPRYTITRALPYDRPNTSMSRFSQCGPCRAEYDDPASRRFHAQPNACPACGPQLTLADAAGRILHVGDPIEAVMARLRQGEIVAVKGLGGFHLACDARNAMAVAKLRERKGREEKPLAVMVAGLASLEALAEVDEAAHALLESRTRPIVLLRKRAECDDMLAGVAPGIAWLGAMLPYTPVHYLLFHEAAGRPAGTAWLDLPQPLVLVMTSANPGGEPIVTDNREAFERLAGIADAFLVHDRDVLVRCDDSVMRYERTQSSAPDRRIRFIRRARGYIPAAIKLPRPGPSVLALGGWLKNTVCVTRGDEAFLSQHVGDLDNAATCRALEQTVAHLRDILQVRPECVAHDLHPDFYSTRFGADFARERGVPAVAVQHHHAHIAAVAAEHGETGRVLGLALDGVGLGADGGIWGGELLSVEGACMQRVGHLRELPLPGGDRAAKEPWRVAAGVLALLGRASEIERRFRQPGASTVVQMLARGTNTPLTSSAGRWFDAAAALLGIRETSSFEGQAAMLLEGLADQHGPVAPLATGYIAHEDGVLDFLPLLEALVDCDDRPAGAALFHATFAAGLIEWTATVAARAGIGTVALSGGCFMNAILTRQVREALTLRGLRVLEAEQAPPNDGGLSLGQAWVAIEACQG